jgi:flagellar basal-body rod protein FlgB
MTEGIEAVTTTLLGLALDAASLRQQAIAANIANADVAGYAPLAVDFESQLDGARRDIGGVSRIDAAALSQVVPALVADASPQPFGLPPKVMLDLEVAHLAQNGVQYQALVTGLSKHYAILALAVGDGKK